MDKKGKLPVSLLIVLFIYLLILIFYFSFPKFVLTGKVVQTVNLEKNTYLPGENLAGNLIIQIKKNSTTFDLIPANSSFEIWVDGEKIKEYTFAELIKLSYQSRKGNFTYGVFRNVDGLAPAQKGWGFSYCETLRINISQKEEKVRGEIETCEGGTREFLCPDGINKIIQRCVCYSINENEEGGCRWQPNNTTSMEMCINLYSCEGFYNKYIVNLSKLEIPITDKNNDKKIEVMFKLVYRWTTKWNNRDIYCIGQVEEINGVSRGVSGPCDMPNYAANWSPVCGEDNKTYPNACFARCEGMVEVDCYRECPCLPPPQHEAQFQEIQILQLQQQPIRTHEVVISNITFNVSIKLPEIECEWQKTCENNAEWNVTNKVWLEYSGINARERCNAAMCTLNDSLRECKQQSQPLQQQPQPKLKIIDTCQQAAGITPTYKFSIYRCDYQTAIEILEKATRIYNLLPDNAYLGDEIRDKIRDCPPGQQCINNECRPVGGGPGGGGGGGIVTPCYPQWQCSDYGECQPDGYKYRNCFDINNCKEQDIEWWQTTGCSLTSNPTLCLQGLIMPSTKMPCVLPCEENWQCTPWSDCVGGIQTRECFDLNDCGTTYNKPATTQACEITYQPPTEKEKKAIEWWKLVIPILILLIIIIAIIISILLTRRKPSIAIEETKEAPPELTEYVKNALKKGASRKEIEGKLKAAGWPQDLIDLAFERVKYLKE